MNSTLIDFSTPNAVTLWRPVDDAVMGGMSSSQLRHDPAGYAVFTGKVSLENNGGFASVRCQPSDLGRRDVAAYVLQVRGDGKHYKLNLRTDDGFDGINYQARFDPPAGVWGSCRIALADFVPTWRGRPVPDAPPLDARQVRQIGLMIADRQEGRFELALRCIGVEAVPALTFRPMRRDEVDLLVDWAAREGWNPGLHDAGLFWATDPDAFLGAELDGELIGGGAITAYGDEFGFLGFFIVQPAYRGKGLGDALWHVLQERLLGRLRPSGTIGIDGVFNMQPYYAACGFVFSHRNLRFRYAPPAPDVAPHAAASAGGKQADQSAAGARLVALAEVPFDALCAYDRNCFPAERARFLAGWIAQPDGLALGCLRNDALVGYGVLRRCREGVKIGPLFADDADVAATLFDALAAFAGRGPVFLDVPENNPGAMALVRARAMTEVFGCARMYLGPVPAIRHERVFGVTTFELG